MTDNRKIAQLRSENEALDLERREITGRLRRGGMLPVFGAAAILIGLTMVISSLAFVGWLVMLAGGGMLLWLFLQRRQARSRLAQIEQEIQYNEEQIRAEMGLN